MKKNLLFILLILLVIAGVVLAYFAFIPQVHSDLPALAPLPATSTGETTGNEKTFEESFYQDLSDLFNGNTNGYEDIQGEYGFTAG